MMNDNMKPLTAEEHAEIEGALPSGLAHDPQQSVREALAGLLKATQKAYTEGWTFEVVALVKPALDAAHAAIAAQPEQKVEAKSRIEELENVCAEAYQVVGVLLSELGEFETERATKILDNLSEARMVHSDVLPWESAVSASERQTKLRELADRIDHEQLWRRPGLEHRNWPQEMRDRLDAGIHLRRYAELLEPNRWLIFPPTGPVRFSAVELDEAVQMAKREEARRADTSNPVPFSPSSEQKP